uniref:30S ribosomal protein S8 n=1 Tax=Caulerpa lentillifera TaxID=148947 RepID=A0A345HGW1_9CHLO|nr:30S ribosomal protein S8 [Caulerpa lentillifera]AXG75851.1 30S ribosomal protein S8 [Caulerpa lentillifera]
MSDLFTSLRNASLIRRQTVTVPKIKINQKIANVLFRHGFIDKIQNSSEKNCLILTLKYKKDQPLITQIRRLSRRGCRVYVPSHQIPQFCGKLGIILMSTSCGIITDREARKFCIGGELLGFVS